MMTIFGRAKAISLVILLFISSSLLIGCVKEESRHYQNYKGGERLTEEEKAENVYTMTDDELKEWVESKLTDSSIINNYPNMTAEYLKRFKRYYDEFEYYGDTLYSIDVSEYSNPGDHIFMFPIMTELIEDGDDHPWFYSILLDPREEYYVSNYKNDNGTITMNENIWRNPTFEKSKFKDIADYSYAGSVFDIEEEKGLDFIRQNSNLVQNLGNKYETKAGDKIISLEFVGVVEAEDYNEIISMPLQVAVDDYRSPALIRVPFRTHEFSNIKEVTFEELSELFSPEKTRL